MSTILKALQKNKREQSSAGMINTHSMAKASHWKTATFLALFIIIALSSALIYLQVTPQTKPQEQVISQQKVITSASPIAGNAPKIDNELVKISFETKPLPKVIHKPKPIKIVSTPKKVIPKKNHPKNQTVSSKNNDVEAESDLERRFKLALLLDDIEKKGDPKSEFKDEMKQEETGDGSDIHEMGSAFQNKIPLIRYDAHMYSSDVSDRWIRINDEVLKEGQFDSTGKLELLEIQPQRSIFRLDRQSFSIESLTDWKGY